MSKQWQLRRGTKAENDIFTGAEGEVTMCTDTKSLRVHDGTTQGGFDIDTVVEFQLPSSSNNYTWYRKYASGWVEQGGVKANNNGNATTVNLPVEMSDTNYTVQLTPSGSNYIGLQVWYGVTTKNTTSFIFYLDGSSQDPQNGEWEVKGMAA